MQFVVQRSPGLYAAVPPDVTTGRVVVVVGGLVVVVGGEVVVVAAGGLVVEVAPTEPVEGVVVGAGADDVLVVVDEAPPVVVGSVVVGPGDGAGALAPAEEPGCSLATVTQMTAVAPPAATIAVEVRRLRRACACVRANGEPGLLPRVTADHRRGARAHERDQTLDPRCAPSYGPNLKT